MTGNEDVDRHPVLLESIAADHAHSIQILQSPHPINRYTCLMHVFDFTEKPYYIAIADCGLGHVYADADFAHWLIKNGELDEVPSNEARPGDLVMYFGDGVFRHVGLLQQNGRVISKWGIGYLYDHAILETPESYGTDIKFYRALSNDDAFDAFTRFAEENGIRFENAVP